MWVINLDPIDRAYFPYLKVFCIGEDTLSPVSLSPAHYPKSQFQASSHGHILASEEIKMQMLSEQSTDTLLSN